MTWLHIKLKVVLGLLKKILPHRRLNIAVSILFFTSIAVGIFLIPQIAFAESILSDLTTFSALFTFELAKLAIKIAVFFLEFFIDLASYNGYIDAPVVTLGWLMVRDVANMFFVVVLLAIAIGTILGIESYEWKKTLVKFILAAVLINFSRLICGIIIDVAHVFTITFLNAIAATAGGNLIQLFNLDQIFDVLKNTGPADFAVDQGDLRYRIVAASVFALIMAGTAAATIGIYAIIMVARVVVLWVLIIISPLAFIFQTIPQAEGFAKQIWDKFIKHVMVAPVMVFFLWLAFATLSTGQDFQKMDLKRMQNTASLSGAFSEAQVSQDKPVGKAITLTDASSWESLAHFIVATAFLIVGINVVQGMGVVAGGLVQKAQDFVTDVAKFATGYSTGKWLYETAKKESGEGIKNFLMEMPGGGQFWQRQGKRIQQARRYNPMVRHIPLVGKYREIYNEKMMSRVDKRETLKREAMLKDSTKINRPITSAIAEDTLNWIPKLAHKATEKLGDITGMDVTGFLGTEGMRAGSIGLGAATYRRNLAEVENMAAMDMSSVENKKFRMAQNKRDLIDDGMELVVRVENDHFDEWAKDKDLYSEDNISDTLGQQYDGRKWNQLNEKEQNTLRDAQKEKHRLSFTYEKGKAVEDDLDNIRKQGTVTSPSNTKMGRFFAGVQKYMPASMRAQATRNAAHTLYQKLRVSAMEADAEASESVSKKVSGQTLLAKKEDIFAKKAAAMTKGKLGEDYISAAVADASAPIWDSAREKLDEARALDEAAGGDDNVKKLLGDDKHAAALYHEQEKNTAEKRAEEAKSLAEKALGQTNIGKELLESFAEAEIGKKISDDFVKGIKDTKLKADWEEAKKKLSEVQLKAADANSLFASDSREADKEEERSKELQERLELLPSEIKDLDDDARELDEAAIAEDAAGQADKAIASRKLAKEEREKRDAKQIEFDEIKGTSVIADLLKSAETKRVKAKEKRRNTIGEAKEEREQLLAADDQISRFAQAIHYSEESEAAAKEATAAKDQATQAHADAEDSLFSADDPDGTIRNRLARAGIVSQAVAAHMNILTGSDTAYKDAAEKLKALKKEIADKMTTEENGKKVMVEFDKLDPTTQGEIKKIQDELKKYLETDAYAMDIYYGQQKALDDAREKKFKSDATGEFSGVKMFGDEYEGEREAGDEVDIGGAVFKSIKDYEIGATIGEDVVKQLENAHLQDRYQQLDDRMREINVMDHEEKSEEREKLLESSDVVGMYARSLREKTWAENVTENGTMMQTEAAALINSAYLEEMMVGKGMYSQGWVASAKRITDSALARLDEPARGEFTARTWARLVSEYEKAKSEGKLETGMDFQKYAYGVTSNAVSEANFDDGLDKSGEIIHLMESNAHYRKNMMSPQEVKDFQALSRYFGAEGEFSVLERQYQKAEVGDVETDEAGNEIMRDKNGVIYKVEREAEGDKRIMKLLYGEDGEATVKRDDKGEVISISDKDGQDISDSLKLGDLSEVRQMAIVDEQENVLLRRAKGNEILTRRTKKDGSVEYKDQKGDKVELEAGEEDALTYITSDKDFKDQDERVAYTTGMKRVSSAMSTNTIQNFMGTGGRADLVRVHRMVEQVMDSEDISNYDDAARLVYSYVHSGSEDVFDEKTRSETVGALKQMRAKFDYSHKDKIAKYQADKGIADNGQAADEYFRDNLVMGDKAAVGLTVGSKKLNNVVEKSLNGLIKTFSKYETRLNDMSYQYKQDAVKTGHFQLGGHQKEDARMKVVRMATTKEARSNINATIRKTDIGTKANPQGYGSLNTDGYVMDEVYFKVIEESLRDKKRYQDISQVKKRTAESYLGFRPDAARKEVIGKVKMAVDIFEKNDDGSFKLDKNGKKKVARQEMQEVDHKFVVLGDGREVLSQRYDSMEEFFDKVVFKDILAGPEAFNNLLQKVVGMVDQFDSEAGLHFAAFEDNQGQMHTSTSMDVLIENGLKAFYGSPEQIARFTSNLKKTDGVSMSESEFLERANGIAEAFKLKAKNRLLSKRTGQAASEDRKKAEDAAAEIKT